MNLLNSGSAKQSDASLSPQSTLHSINSFDTLSSFGSMQPFMLNSQVPNKDTKSEQLLINSISGQKPQDQQNPQQDLISQQIQALLVVKEQHEQQQAQQRAVFDQLLLQLQAQHFIRTYQQQQQQQKQQQQCLLQQNLLLFQLQQQSKQFQQNQLSQTQQPTFINTNNVNINMLGGIIDNSLLNFMGGNNNNNNPSILDPVLPASSSNFFSQFLGTALPLANNMPVQELAGDNLKLEKGKGLPVVQSNTSKLCTKRKKANGKEMELKKKVKIELPKKTSISLETEDSEETIEKKQEKLQNSNISMKTCSTSSITKTEAQEDQEEEEDDNGVNTSKDGRSRSKFHNLTKLFLNSLLSIFTKENMDLSGVLPAEQEDVVKCITRVKQSGRKTQGKVCKTDLFNHSHYNVLFLKLTPESIMELASKPKDAAIHKLCFDVDFNEVFSQQQIDAVNRTKHNIFIITHTILANPANKDSIKHEYWQRAIVGIRQLAQGKLIYRFQSLSKNQQLHHSQNIGNIKVEASPIPSDNNSSLLSLNLSSSI